MLITIGLWLALFAILFGVGGLALRCVDRKIEDPEAGFTAFWLGWAFSIAVLQIWNLFAAIGPASFWSIALLGAIGLVANRNAFGAGIATLRRQVAERPVPTALLLCVAALFVLWLSNRAMGPITPKGDAGLYHVSVIRWLQSHPAVPGLGNLDGRFIFNNSSFLFLGMLDLVQGPPHFYHLGNPLLILVFSAQAWMYLGQVLQRRERVEGHRLLGCLWLAVIVPYYFMEFSSTSTDIVNLMLGLLLGVYLFKIVFQPLSLRELGFHTALVVLFSAVGISNKLSFLFLGGTISAVAVLRFGARAIDGRSSEAFSRLRPYLGTALLTALLALSVLIPWVIRGIISSGYVAYPSNTVLYLDVDWKVPEALVVHENKNIRVSARTPHEDVELARFDEVLEGWSWFVPWLGETAKRADIFTVPLALFAISAVAYGIRRRSTREDLLAALYFMAPAALAFMLWFLSAPAERFAGGIFWLLGAGMTAVYFQQERSEAARRRLVRIDLAFIATTVALALVVSTVFSEQRYGWAVFVPPGPEQGFHPIPEVETADFTTDSGLKLHVPTRVRSHSSDWNPLPFCWDAPLPCTHRPKTALELREPGDLSKGFRRRNAG